MNAADLSSASRRSAPYAVDGAARVVRHEHGAVAVHEHVHRPPPAAAVGALPAGDEVLVGRRLAVLHADADDLGAGGRAAVPRAVEGEQGVALVVARELAGAGQEREA